MNSTYEFTLKEGPKVKIKNFRGTKSWRNFLEGLKRKVDTFTGTKNIFNPKNNRHQTNCNKTWDLFYRILRITNSHPWKRSIMV